MHARVVLLSLGLHACGYPLRSAPACRTRCVWLLPGWMRTGRAAVAVLTLWLRQLISRYRIHTHTHMPIRTRRTLSSLVRLGWQPSASWLLSADKEVAARLSGTPPDAAPASSAPPSPSPAAPSAPATASGGRDARQLASLLVSFASLGHVSPSPGLREAAYGAVRELFILAEPSPETLRPACGVLWSCALLGIALYDMTVSSSRGLEGA